MRKFPWLTSIQYPADLKKVPREKLSEVAGELRDKIDRKTGPQTSLVGDRRRIRQLFSLTVKTFRCKIAV